jgi:hypothetical protein
MTEINWIFLMTGLENSVLPDYTIDMIIPDYVVCKFNPSWLQGW